MDIGKIKQVPLREIWKREDSDKGVTIDAIFRKGAED